jgi:hypothetical protein
MTALLMAAAVMAPMSDCQKTFTLKMDERGARAIYAGTHDLSRWQEGLLRRLERCQRQPADVRRARAYNGLQRLRWSARRYDRSHPYSSAMASYYDLGGSGACGVDVQAGYRFASLFLPCGARVEMCHVGCVEAVMSDAGPYVSGRLFDLNVNLRDGIGCPDLCEVRWRR